MSDVLVVAAHALRESLRRRVFAVVVCLTLAFGALYAWGTDELFKDVSDFGPNQSGWTRARSPARRSSASRCSGRCSSASCSRSSSPSARCAATPSAGCCSR